jgi:addiction module HigA family antidote
VRWLLRLRRRLPRRAGGGDLVTEGIRDEIAAFIDRVLMTEAWEESGGEVADRIMRMLTEHGWSPRGSEDNRIHEIRAVLDKYERLGAPFATGGLTRIRAILDGAPPAPGDKPWVSDREYEIGNDSAPAPRVWSLGSPLHPGETIREFVQSRTEPGIWYQKQIAERAGITEKHLSQIAQGNVALSAPIAVKIEAATGMSAELLMCLQVRYDIARARVSEAGPEGGQS